VTCPLNRGVAGGIICEKSEERQTCLVLILHKFLRDIPSLGFKCICLPISLGTRTWDRNSVLNTIPNTLYMSLTDMFLCMEVLYVRPLFVIN
jgi:hypothetical protein